MNTNNRVAGDLELRSAASIEQMAEVRRFTTGELQELKLIHSQMGESSGIKAFRDLRTRLMGLAGGKPFSCMVVSAESGGGSHVAVNLAAAIALDRTKSSVLVDCNLYSPSVDKYMPVDSGVGLTDFLDDPSVACEDIVYGTGVARMRAVPVGNNREGGTEKLTSKRMSEFLRELVARYDDRYIIVDAPPVSRYEAEVRILSDLCDLVVLVVPYGKVTSIQLEAEIDKIGRSKLAGVVYNEC
ncbi:MAG TPA: CpsD/CapB family tyrosine-protein kinase [Marinagarivorans sp.]